MVGNMVSTLKAEGELKNTVFIFTADNGFFHGEHRVRNGKVRHYEESSGVPLIIRGPGVPKNQRRAQLAVNADLAPTILDYAGGKVGRPVDGRSLVPVIEDKLFAGARDPDRGLKQRGSERGRHPLQRRSHRPLRLRRDGGRAGAVRPHQ